MTLQFIHKTNGASKASSTMYCRWVTTKQGKGERLVAVWIDPEMRAFETEFAVETQRNEKPTSNVGVAAQLQLNVQEDEVGGIRIEEA